MTKKSLLILILFILSNTISFGQEIESVLTAPDDWKNEIIPFPLSFAPTIDFVGFEDLRFAPNWSDSTSQNFWAYSFVWYIEKNSAMTENNLTKYFNAYYDGLMGVDENNLDKTLCLFIKTKAGFTGKMRVYDRFFTKDYMTLNIKVTEQFCTKTNKQIVSCDISPQSLDNAVWSIFDVVELKEKCK